MCALSSCIQALSSILHRKRLALSTAEWKSIPWQAIPKDMKDILVDALVDVPGLVEDFDNMQLCTEPNRQGALRAELVQKCWELDQQLRSWSSFLRQMVKHGVNPCTTEDIVTHIAQVHGMSLFWTTSLVLYTILRLAFGPGQQRDNLPERTDPMHHARKLAEAIGILLTPAAGLYGRQSAALPLGIALQYAPLAQSLSPSPEGGSLLEILNGLQGGMDNR